MSQATTARLTLSDVFSIAKSKFLRQDCFLLADITMGTWFADGAVFITTFVISGPSILATIYLPMYALLVFYYHIARFGAFNDHKFRRGSGIWCVHPAKRMEGVLQRMFLGFGLGLAWTMGGFLPEFRVLTSPIFTLTLSLIHI